jgi:DNA transformation protein
VKQIEVGHAQRIAMVKALVGRARSIAKSGEEGIDGRYMSATAAIRKALSSDVALRAFAQTGEDSSSSSVPTRWSAGIAEAFASSGVGGRASRGQAARQYPRRSATLIGPMATENLGWGAPRLERPSRKANHTWAERRNLYPVISFMATVLRGDPTIHSLEGLDSRRRRADEMKGKPRKATDDTFTAFVIDQLRGLGAVEARSMFGGKGLYWKDQIFALIDENQLYFRASEGTAGQYEVEGSKPFEPWPGHIMKGYYEVPARVLEDPEQAVAWAHEAWSLPRRKVQRRRQPKVGQRSLGGRAVRKPRRRTDRA